jgi:hypothetical protein
MDIEGMRDLFKFIKVPNNLKKLVRFFYLDYDRKYA